MSSKLSRWGMKAAVICVIVALGFSTVSRTLAQMNGVTSLIPDEHKVVVIYTNESGQVDAEVRLLDLLLGQFTSDIKIFSDREVDATAVEESTHLVYFGMERKTIPPETAKLIQEYKKPLFVIGENLEQLGARVWFFSTDTDIVLAGVAKPGLPIAPLDNPSFLASHIELAYGEVLLEGWTEEGRSYPVLVRFDETYYLALSFLGNEFYNYVGEGLFNFFGETPPTSHHAYIRLEDIHPASEPHLIKEVGEYLASKGIPFTLIVIPVYINPETYEEIRLKEKPELVKVLRDLQRRGGSVVLHGYTHQYRLSETGEGFEFWNVENNTPIYAPADEPFTLKSRSEFATEQEYEEYMNGLLEFEKEYITTRIEKGIEELNELGLTPLAFEAPHYTMSQQGYRIVADYFDYIFGQIQLSDEDWEFMSASPYISRPSFLHGLTLIPENVGYYDITSPTPLMDMLKKIEAMRPVQGSMLGMFYHPYLGKEYLMPIIEHLESFPGLQWFDLKDVADPLLLDSRQKALNNPFIVLKVYFADFLRSVMEGGTFYMTLWLVAGLTSIMSTLFVINTLRNRLGIRKQLFEEQRINV